MHELSIAQGLIELIEEQARLDPFTRVRRAVVELGALSHVEPRALAAAFEAASRGTVAEGAVLILQNRPGLGYCLACRETAEVAARGDPCPRCGEVSWIAVDGERMRLETLEVE